ncbi:hypothetical protein GCM10020255_061000 [Rhodococcus baikonurensis]
MRTDFVHGQFDVGDGVEVEVFLNGNGGGQCTQNRQLIESRLNPQLHDGLSLILIGLECAEVCHKFSGSSYQGSP